MPHPVPVPIRLPSPVLAVLVLLAGLAAGLAGTAGAMPPGAPAFNASLQAGAAAPVRPEPALRRQAVTPQACPDCPATADTVFVNDFQNSPLARGGSNLLWFHVDPVDPDDPDPLGACIAARDPRHLANYRPGVRVRVLEILAAMRAARQHRLSTGLLHLRADPTEAAGAAPLDSTGGLIAGRASRTVPADIAATGFDEICSATSQGANTAIGWDSFSEDLYQENWQLIRRRRSWKPRRLSAPTCWWRACRAWFTTLPVAALYIDADRPANRAWSEYARRLWRDYVAQFGPERSVGFSFVTDANAVRTRARVRHVDYVYRLADGSQVFPPVFAFDIYGGGAVSDRTIFERHHHAMADIGRQESWIVAESWFNDAGSAADLKAALESTGRQLAYFTQWPLDRQVDDCGVNVAAPVAYEAWLRRGF